MRKLLTILLLSISSIAFAQEMSVKSFYLAETDLTANTPGTLVHDQNGNVCALIKIETLLDGFSFDVGSLGVREVKRVGGEIWVYVPFGIRKITISHSQIGVIRDYPLPCSVEKGRTYIMTLVAGTVRTIVEYAASKQFLYIELNPKDAILEINGKVKVTDNGIYQELLPFGKYEYKAYSQNYHDLAGVVEISNPNNTHSLNLKLKPAFGYLSVTTKSQADLAGASVYIDEKYIGKIPINNIQINSGSHRLRIIKEFYKAHNEQFTISDEETKQLTPYLNPDFAEVTLTTSEGADIYINGEKKGNQKWFGKLPCGSYLFETRKKGHIAYKTTYEISRNDHFKSITLDAPTPIFGSLVVSSTPAKAKVYIDDEYVGETPKYISKQVIGDYSVTVKLTGYDSQTKSINITEGSEASISFNLVEAKPVETKQTYNTPSVLNLKSKNSETIKLFVGQKVKLKIDNSMAWWTTRDKSVVNLESDGNLIALKRGTATLYAYTSGGVVTEVYVSVDQSINITEGSELSVSLNPVEAKPVETKQTYNTPSVLNLKSKNSETIKLFVGQKVKLKIDNSMAWWTTRDKSVVNLESDGNLIALKRGTATLYAYTSGGVVTEVYVSVDLH